MKKKHIFFLRCGRIALKFGNNIETLTEELCYEDISIMTLNELFSNNLHVKIEDGNYVVTCKYKSVNNVFSLINVILNDAFYQMFHEPFEATLQCEVRM